MKLIKVERLLTMESLKYENTSFRSDEIRIWREIIARGHGQIFTLYTFDRNNGTVNFYNYDNDLKLLKSRKQELVVLPKNLLKRICFNLFLGIAETLIRFLLFYFFNNLYFLKRYYYKSQK